MFTRLLRKIGKLIGRTSPRIQAQVEAGEALMERYRDVFAALANR